MKRKGKSATAASSSNTDNDRFCCVLCILLTPAFILLLAIIFIAATLPKKEPKLPEFRMTGMNITNMDSNSSTAITVEVQVRNPTDFNVTYHTMHVFVVKDGLVINEVSLPPLGLNGEEDNMEVKARFVVANGDGIGFDYWAAAAGAHSEERIRALYFDVWAWAGVDDLQDIEELRVKCQAVAVGFQKGARVGFMVDAVKTCTVEAGWSTVPN